MNVKKWLKIVANVVPSDIPDDDGMVYVSKFDSSYITRVGMEKGVIHLAKYEITEELTHGVGFSPTHGKWYGWSHRAIFGFAIGSTCGKGDCHFVPSSKEEFNAKQLEFWSSDYHEKTWCEEGNGKTEDHLGVRGVFINWVYNDKVPNVKLRGTKSSNFYPYPEKFGRGEWTAMTMEDAKQMAMDFNEGVS